VSGTIGCGKGRYTRCGVRAQVGLALTMAALLPSVAYAITTPPTIANNTFASTPVGQSLTQTVTLTLTSASAIKSIALATGTSASSEYTLKSVSDCTVDGTTVNASGTVCSLSVKYTPLSPGSLASPALSRNAQLLYTDGSSTVTAYGLSGAATKAIGHVVPGTISLYAGQPYTVSGTSPLDNSLGQTNGGYAGNGVAATAATFQFSTYNAILTENIPSNGSQPLAFDSQGNLYVIDGANFVIRKIDNSSSHLVTTIAGTPSAQGYTGNGGAATSAKLNNPRGLTLDAAGNLYFLDQTTVSFFGFPAYVIRRIDAVTGIITAVAGENFTGTYDSIDGGGTCDLSNAGAYAIYQCGDGGLATYAYLNTPYNLALDSAGNFYLWGGNFSSSPYVRKITAATGIISNIGNETNLNSIEVFGGMTLGSDGNLYVLAIDKTSETVEIKQLNPTTQVVTSLAGSTAAYTGCGLPSAQQKGFPAANLGLAPGIEANLGDLSSDASGNLYVNDDLCTNGAISVYDFPPSIVRINIATTTAYDEVVADAYPYGGTQSIGYNAFYFYGIFPVSAVSDNAGNIFFTSWNQIAELSGQSAELDFTSRYDFTTSAAQTATYANLGNASGAAPAYTFQSGTNFVLLETGDTNACDALTSVAVDGTCDLDIAFSPTAVGALTDTLNVSGSEPADTVTVNGIGVAAAQFGISPASLDFGNQTVDVASAFKTFTLTDTGTANLTIANFYPDGTNGFANYEVVANGGTCSTTASTVLTPSSSCTVEITFTPSVLGPLPATFYVNTSISFGDVATLTGTGAAAPATVTETGNLWFNPAPVAIAAASAQTLTATFTIKGLASLITPTATMHYGLAYKVGKVTCTGAAGDQTCSVPVTFIPNYPGGRKDALFLMNGTTRLATELAFGVGQSPFALIQPGVITNPILNGPQYYYDSTVDENGTAYVVEQENNSIISVTAAGVVTTVPITGLESPRGVGLDGAGILYVADQKPNSSITTYDTVQGIQGGIPFPNGAGYVQNVTTGNEGNIYATNSATIYTIAPDGTTTSVPISPANTQASRLTVDDQEDLFIGGYAINEIPFGGTQVQVNTTGAGDGLSVDAALTLYACRYSNPSVSSDSVGELPASGYGTAQAELDSSANPLGCSDGPDGTLYVGNYFNLDKVDRSQGAPIAFGEQTNGTPSQPATFQIYNGGNETLTLATFAVSGEGFAVQTGTTDACAAGLTIAPGALCDAPIVFTGTHSGNFTGTISYSSNTLNTTATAGTVGLSAYVNGIYVTVAPNPLNFGNQTVNTTSATQTVTLTNNGVNANFGGFNVLPSSVAGFNITQGTCSGKIAPGDSCSFDVTFSPTMAQAYTGTSTFTAASDASTQTQTVSFTLNGMGTPAAAVTASPNPVDLGSVMEYTENFDPVYVTITNSTAAQVIFTSFASNDPAEFNSQDYSCAAGGYIPAGTSCQISVRFSPQSVGLITSSINAVYTGSGGGTLVINLSGTGTIGTPAIDLYPLPANFGTLPVMTAATPITLQVEDTGTAPITGISATITGANASDYTQTNNCSGVTIVPSGASGGGTCNITVSFTPSAGGARVATLNVSSNSGAATFSTPLNGAGVAQVPQIQFTPTQLNLFAGAAGNCGDTTTGGAATAATLCNINNAAQDFAGNTYLVDTHYNVVYKVDTTGKISIFAGTPSTTGGYSGDGGTATSATLSGPTAASADVLGNIYISDTANSAIRVVNPTGTINSFVDSQCEDSGRGTPHSFKSTAKVGKLHPHDVELCETFQPEGLVVDSFGNLIFADTLNNVVLAVNLTTQDLTFVAGDAETFMGTAGYNGDNQLADGAELNAPQDVAVDSAGNVYIADTLNYRIRKVTTATGIITTVAGDGTQGNTGDGAAATSAEINAYGVATDLGGDVFIGAGTGGLVRKVDISGNITTFAGGGTGPLGGPASTGAVTNAYFVRADNSGDLLIPSGLQVLAAGPDGLLQFGTEPIGSTTSALTATVENTGDSNVSIESTGVTLTGADASDFAITGNNCGSALAPGKTCAITATFTPSASGARTASISVGSNVAGSPETVLLQGNGMAASAPAASLSPTSLSFPNTTAGTTAAALSTTLSNTANATLNISGITLTGANVADFAIAAAGTTCGTTLAAVSSCTISVTFTPAAVATYTASISVADDAAGTPQTATLSGTGTAVPAPIASLSPTTLTFPSTTAGTTSAAMSTTLSNTGNAVLNISGITLTGTNTADFAETTTCGTTLAAGSTCTISATFAPAAAGSYTASISVADDATGSPQTATLSGTGTAAPAPIASLSPTTLAFPSTTAGSTATALSTTLSNTGNAVLNISGITLTGTNTADFAITTSDTACGATLAAGSTCTISATFTPAAAGSFTASISVADNAAGSPQTAALSGTGLTPPATDFALTATPPAQTVSSGSVATFTVNATGIGGDFANAVNLTVTGLPSGFTGTFTPASITPGATGASSTLTIQTTRQAALANPGPLHHAPVTPWLAALLVVPLLGLRRRLKKLRLVSCMILLAATLVPTALLTGCGGGYFSITSQTYTLTVTGTSGSIQHSTTVTLTVQQ
jgi:hypothetical protein